MTEKHYWWKILGVVLMLFVLTQGLLNPLKHGIVDVSPDRFKVSETIQLNISAYNANYLKEANPLEVFLKHIPDRNVKTREDFLLKSIAVKPIQDNLLNVTFQLPDFIPDSRKIALFTLIVNSSVDGAAAIPSKVIIHQDSVNVEEGKRQWTLPELPKFHVTNSSHFPYRNILVETIRNTFFHVSLWFAMFLMFGMSVYFSAKYLKTNDPDADLRSFALVRTGLLFGLLGCLTGSLWARYTWETWWTTDIKLNMSALTILIYVAYLVLRASIDDRDRKARISSAYNIFALVAVIPLIFVLPRLTDSLHPGNGGNPAFGSDDMDNSLRMVFYPAVLGFMFIGLWMASLLYRVERIKTLMDEKENY